MDDSQALDIPITQLRPLRDRKVGKREYDRILSTIKSVGLLEPLIVFPEGPNYVILDGVLRYRALLELGVKVVPCILGKQREAFTGNRMVNRVSPIQENRMIERSMEELDEQTIASAFGVNSISHRLRKFLLKQLHPDVAAAFDEGKITKGCAEEMTNVKPPRQAEILAAMHNYQDYTSAFARSLILKTPKNQREHFRRRVNPWEKGAKRKNSLLKKLADAEQKHDFYSRLYRQYTVDLLRLAIYARSLLTNVPIRQHLDRLHPQIVMRIESIIADAQG